MRRYLFIFFIFFSFAANAQPVLPLSGFQNALLLYNPAYAGSSEGLCFSALHKTQWAGFDGSPKLYALTAHAPFNYERIGMGINLLNESTGQQNYFYCNANFSYKINFLRGRLSLGAKAGLVQWSDRSDKLLVKDNEELLTGNKIIIPEFGGGIFYKDKKYTTGLSIQYVPGIYIGNTTTGKIYYHFTVATDKKITKNSSLKPALLVRVTQGFVPELSLSLPVEFNKLIWVGLSYRNPAIYTFMAGLNIHQVLKNTQDRINLFYYYDYTAGSLSNKFGNSHEVVFLLSPGKNRNPETFRKKRVTVSPLLFD